MDTFGTRNSDIRLMAQHKIQSTKSQHPHSCSVSCRLRRNTFLPGEQIEGTVKLAVSSQDHDVEIEEVSRSCVHYLSLRKLFVLVVKIYNNRSVVSVGTFYHQRARN